MFDKIIKRKNGAYVVNDVCLPHPDDASIPEDIRAQFAKRWHEADAYAKEHPVMVKEEHPYEPTAEELAAAALAKAKADRAAAVAAITVEVDGMVFDGDEAAQERMARAVLMADSLDEETEWVLADSTVAVVTAAQLRRACRAAGKNQTILWVKPYTS